ncbi:hypothetical protein M0638_05205 [Roseomonas sp. NAR14]|uniref:Uncharacterized protein n=1 Tax=Roseomonas acroporae TaxID=2937791 RepID=A0A9X2BV93_9PROT|nr:hypothetical protein [Roseomonas acroporae]MCK8783779.1 hypothetical protein [Roseomonas acroporae]
MPTVAIRPSHSAPRTADRRRPLPGTGFTRDSVLEQMIVRMISLNSLAAFAADVTQAAGLPGGAGAARDTSPTGRAAASVAAGPEQRTLAAVPAAPTRPLPRGSLLDLRV